MTLRTVHIIDELYQVGGYGQTLPENVTICLIDFGGHAALNRCGGGHALDKLLNTIEVIAHPPRRAEGATVVVG